MWRCARIENDALNMYRQIRAWWATGKVTDANISQMDCWLSWWHVRYPRWKKHFSQVFPSSKIHNNSVLSNFTKVRLKLFVYLAGNSRHSLCPNHKLG